jgi:hypothetical protein
VKTPRSFFRDALTRHLQLLRLIPGTLRDRIDERARVSLSVYTRVGDLVLLGVRDNALCSVETALLLVLLRLREVVPRTIAECQL